MFRYAARLDAPLQEQHSATPPSSTRPFRSSTPPHRTTGRAPLGAVLRHAARLEAPLQEQHSATPPGSTRPFRGAGNCATSHEPPAPGRAQNAPVGQPACPIPAAFGQLCAFGHPVAGAGVNPGAGGGAVAPRTCAAVRPPRAGTPGGVGPVGMGMGAGAGAGAGTGAGAGIC
ncbi:hypothetical protein ACFWIJ_09880, partial [Streptomyces sp. NPDC127079]